MKKNMIFILTMLIILFIASDAKYLGIDQPTEVKAAQVAITEKLPQRIDHIVIVVEENHAEKEIKGNPSAPYINYLIKQGAYLTNYHAIEHPSQPNYLDLFSGSNQGVMNDRIPKIKFSTPNLGSELLQKHLTFTGYSEDLPSVGFNGGWTSKGPYARKYNPWVNFSNIPKEANQPLIAFPKDFRRLPTVSFVIPNLQNDMHDGSINQGDSWLKKHLDSYVQWAKKNNSLLIVTWDEDDSSQHNKIPAIFVGPMVKPGLYGQNYTHFSLLKTLEELYKIPFVGKSANAVKISGIWK